MGRFAKIVAGVVMFFSAAVAIASPYGQYDMSQMFKKGPGGNGRSMYYLDGPFFDRVVNDMASHAKNRPVKFDSFSDRRRAEKDIEVLMEELNLLVTNSLGSNDVLIRAAYVHHMAANLKVKRENKASIYCDRLIDSGSANGKAQLFCGAVALSVGKAPDAIKRLYAALDAGVVEAGYTLGVALYKNGETGKAVKIFQAFRNVSGRDPSIEDLISALSRGEKPEVERLLW